MGAFTHTRRAGFALASLLISAGGGSAVAQSLTAITTAQSAYDWSGFYLGTQFGWGWSDQHVEDITGLDGEVGLNGGFFGPVLGIQKQWNNFVLGAEVEANWSDIDGQDSLPGAPGRTFGGIEVFGSAGARIGYAWNRFLIFATAGLSGAETANEERIGPSRSDDHDASFGWMAGAGIDYGVTDNLVLGILYRHYDFGEFDYQMGFLPDRSGSVDLDTITGHVIVKFGSF
jgi:outer membrane immunogenic protein